MWAYIVSGTAIWLVCLLLFDVFLRKENYHGYNRFFLLFTFFLGLLAPMWLWSAGGGMYGDMMNAWLFNMNIHDSWLSVIYLSGVSVALSLLIIDVIRLFVLYRRGKRARRDGWTVIETGDEHPPFSYLDLLYVSSIGDYTEEEWAMLSAHEKQHSLQLHFIDILLMQIARVVFWFNPLVYLYNLRLLLVHEYLADKASSEEPKEYGRFLVEQAMMRPAPSLSQSFNRSPIKNRIIMLTKNGTPQTGLANLKKLMLVLPITIFTIALFTKNSYSAARPKVTNTIWKKQVSRIIDFSTPDDTARHHLKDVSPDSTLLELLSVAIKSGKIMAYSAYDHNFTTKLTKTDFDKFFGTRIDTMILTDPITGQELTKVIKRDFDYALIHKWRLLEEWTFNSTTGKTNIEIQGIQPIKDIYGDDGVFRGVQGMFWIHYTDARKVIDNYELYHPNAITSRIWDDYFTSGTGPNGF